jgi:hypothetical protein
MIWFHKFRMCLAYSFIYIHVVSRRIGLRLSGTSEVFDGGIVHHHSLGYGCRITAKNVRWHADIDGATAALLYELNEASGRERDMVQAQNESREERHVQKEMT